MNQHTVPLYHRMMHHLSFCLLAGLLPVLAAVLDKATQHVQQQGTQQQQQPSPAGRSEESAEDPTQEHDLGKPMNTVLHCEFLASQFQLWSCLVLGWPTAKYTSYGWNGLACTAAPASKLAAAVLKYWATVTGGTAGNTTLSSGSSSSSNTTVGGGPGCGDPDGSDGAAGSSSRQNTHKHSNLLSSADDSLPGHYPSEDGCFIFQAQVMRAAACFILMCSSDFLLSKSNGDWNPPDAIKHLMLSDHTLSLIMGVLASQVQMQHATEAGQLQQHVPPHHMRLLELLEWPPLEPMAAAVLIERPFQELMSACVGLISLCKHRKTASRVAAVAKVNEWDPSCAASHGQEAFEGLTSPGLPSHWLVPVMLTLSEAMVLSPDLYFIQVCCALVKDMVHDVMEHLVLLAFNPVALEKADKLLKTAAATFVQEVLLHVGPAIRQAALLERQPGSGTVAKQFAKNAAASGLPDTCEDTLASDAHGVLRALGKYVFGTCMELGELATAVGDGGRVAGDCQHGAALQAPQAFRTAVLSIL